MIGIVLTGHAHLSSGLLSAATLLMGEPAQAAAVDLLPGIDPEEFGAELLAAGQGVDTGDGAIFLADLRGGTPFNQACIQSRGNGWEVLSGANLPMLVQLLTVRKRRSLEECVEEALAAGTTGITQFQLKKA